MLAQQKSPDDRPSRHMALPLCNDQSGFKSKKIRVNLNLPIKSETKAETTEVLKIVDEDRKYVVQATIVRYGLCSFPL